MVAEGFEPRLYFCKLYNVSTEQVSDHALNQFESEDASRATTVGGHGIHGIGEVLWQRHNMRRNYRAPWVTCRTETCSHEEPSFLTLSEATPYTKFCLTILNMS